MRVLATGSSGQVGTDLALRLAADGREVFAEHSEPLGVKTYAM
jgi:dTDP-4-dehydrorhamnose reductase